MSPVIYAAIVASALAASQAARATEFPTGLYAGPAGSNISVAIEQRHDRAALLVLEGPATGQRRVLTGTCAVAMPSGVGGPAICKTGAAETKGDVRIDLRTRGATPVVLESSTNGLTLHVDGREPIALNRAMTDAAASTCHGGFWNIGPSMWFIDPDPIKREVATISAGAIRMMGVLSTIQLQQSPMFNFWAGDVAITEGLVDDYELGEDPETRTYSRGGNKVHMVLDRYSCRVWASNKIGTTVNTLVNDVTPMQRAVF